jgi:hypothetical protein
MKNRVRVMGVEYAVRFVSSTDKALDGDRGMVWWPGGGEQPFIAINEDNSQDTQREALLHELLHVADVETNGKSHTIIPEAYIDRLARCLYGIFRDNPGLASAIGEPDPPPKKRTR